MHSGKNVAPRRRQQAKNPGWLTIEKSFYSVYSHDSAMHSSGSPAVGSVTLGEDTRAHKLLMPIIGLAGQYRLKVVAFLVVGAADKGNAFEALPGLQTC